MTSTSSTQLFFKPVSPWYRLGLWLLSLLALILLTAVHGVSVVLAEPVRWLFATFIGNPHNDTQALLLVLGYLLAYITIWSWVIRMLLGRLLFGRWRLN